MDIDNIPHHETPQMVVDFKSYKWLVSSCLQKSLRRGRWDLAEQYVKFLWKHDRNYITYRFGILLTEDVGIANMPIIQKYLDTKLAKKQIDEKGGLDFILELTQEACASAKDRSSCDAAYYASYLSFNPKTPSNLVDIFNNQNENYSTRILASWLILGSKKFKQENLDFNLNYPVNEKEDTIDDVDSYRTLIAQNTNDEFANTVINAYWTQTENIFMGMPVVQALFDYEKNHQKEGAKLEVGQIIENMYVKETSFYHKALNLDLISSGIDGHTREGKGAYYRYLKSKNDFVDYLNSQHIASEDHMTILSHCMFRTEGHEVNKRIYFPSAVQIMRDCEQKILDMKMGQTTLDFNFIKKILIQDMPKINRLRDQVLTQTAVPMIEYVDPAVKKTKKKKL